MQTNEVTPERLRALAALRPAQGKVLSVFVNLDPSEFATPQARSTQVSSLLDEAARRIRAEDLGHDEQVALREDVERLRRHLRNGTFDAKGAHAVAVYACGPADLFEVIKLPRPLDSAVVIDDSPFVEPLAVLGPGGHWAVLLVSRRSGRILRGSPERLEVVARVDDDVHGRHDQGGWSQANYQRSVDKEAHDHIRHAADELFARFQRDPFDALLLGFPDELAGEVEDRLHPYLRERIAGRVEVDIDNTSADRVLAAATPLFEEHERKRERAALDRLAEGLGAGGRAAAGLGDVLGVLNEKRVGCLLLADGFDAAGVVCPEDGWMGVGEKRCPVDGSAVVERPDITENAIEAALGQSADILRVRHHDDLESHGGIAALLRF